jgi:hypothetical protein
LIASRFVDLLELANLFEFFCFLLLLEDLTFFGIDCFLGFVVSKIDLEALLPSVLVKLSLGDNDDWSDSI